MVLFYHSTSKIHIQKRCSIMLLFDTCVLKQKKKYHGIGIVYSQNIILLWTFTLFC